MELTVLVEHTGDGYTARDPFGRTATGPTAAAAVAALRAALTADAGEMVRIEIPAKPVPPLPPPPPTPAFNRAEWEQWDRIIKLNRVLGDAKDEGEYRANELIEELRAAGLEPSDLPDEWPV